MIATGNKSSPTMISCNSAFDIVNNVFFSALICEKYINHLSWCVDHENIVTKRHANMLKSLKMYLLFLIIQIE